MFAIRFAAYTPPARDDEAWTVAVVEESSAATGPWTVIETIDLATGLGDQGGAARPIGLDSVPVSPRQRSLTTEAATLAAGWYRIVWLDASGDEAPTRAVFNGANIAPPMGDVALLLATRLKDDVGPVDAFNDTTRPTRTQVDGFIGKAIRRVRLKVGSIPEPLADDAREAVATYTAAMVERSLWPEQTNADASVYDALITEFDKMLADLAAAINEGGDDGDPGTPDDNPGPLGTFPCPAVNWDTEAM